MTGGNFTLLKQSCRYPWIAVLHTKITDWEQKMGMGLHLEI